MISTAKIYSLIWVLWAWCVTLDRTADWQPIRAEKRVWNSNSLLWLVRLCYPLFRAIETYGSEMWSGLQARENGHNPCHATLWGHRLNGRFNHLILLLGATLFQINYTFDVWFMMFFCIHCKKKNRNIYIVIPDFWTSIYLCMFFFCKNTQSSHGLTN